METTLKIMRFAFRETCVSRHHGGQLRAPSKPLGHRSTMELRGLMGPLIWFQIVSSLIILEANVSSPYMVSIVLDSNTNHEL